MYRRHDTLRDSVSAIVRPSTPETNFFSFLLLWYRFKCGIYMVSTCVFIIGHMIQSVFTHLVSFVEIVIVCHGLAIVKYLTISRKQSTVARLPTSDLILRYLFFNVWLDTCLICLNYTVVSKMDICLLSVSFCKC